MKHGTGSLSPRLVPVACLIALAGGGCATNPATGGRQLSLVSEAQEIEMGREYDKQVVASIGLYDDDGLQRYVQELGARLAATSERPNLPWTFRVVDDPVVNAFALPGGFIYVTRGILAHLDSEAQLASVLGHEIGHVTARHSVSRMSTQQLAQIGLAIGSIVSPTVEKYGGIASAGLAVLFLKHSRDDERQADDLGLRYMRRGNYSAREMAEVFTMLERASEAGGGSRMPEWLATHPNPENRRERIAEAVAQLPPDSMGRTVNRDSYVRRLDGIVFGQDPREGYFKGTVFLHPALKFQIEFPESWPATNQKQAVVSVSPNQDGAVQLTLSQQPNAAAAANAFFSQEGISGGPPSRTTIHGLPAAGGPFAASTESGAVRGNAVFVEHGGAVYQILGFAVDAQWSGYQDVVQRTMGSFQPLTDPTAADVQPQKLQIIALDRRATIEELARARSAPVSAERLALLNQVQLTTPLEQGRLVKWVTGRPLDPSRSQ